MIRLRLAGCLAWMVCGLLASLAPVPGAAAEEPTNFVVIMADDLGFADIGCYGSTRNETPAIDKLAEEGLLFADYHANGPVCSPTRAALLTGRYQQRSGIDAVVSADPAQNRHHGLHTDEVTFAELLKPAGYATGVFGKWHVGYEPQFNPVHQGFDAFRGYVSGNICYISHLDRMGIADWWRNDELVPEEGYVTHLITEHAVQFIEEHRDEPFCVYIAHECVHSPYQGPDDPAVRVEGQAKDLKQASRKDIPEAYSEMIAEMDAGVARVIETLERLELSGNTLVFFCSDNGANRHGDNGRLRGFKGSVWEGGHRVPAIAWQPGRVTAGRMTIETAMSMDIMPTLLDIANVTIPDDLHLDGISLAPVIYDGARLPERTLFWKYRKHYAVRKGDWKLVGQVGKPGETLYHLRDDLSESNDVSESHPERAAALQEAYLEWNREILSSAREQPETSASAP